MSPPPGVASHSLAVENLPCIVYTVQGKFSTVYTGLRKYNYILYKYFT